LELNSIRTRLELDVSKAQLGKDTDWENYLPANDEPTQDKGKVKIGQGFTSMQTGQRVRVLRQIFLHKGDYLIALGAKSKVMDSPRVIFLGTFWIIYNVTFYLIYS